VILAFALTDNASVETCTAQHPSPVYSAPADVACSAQHRQEVVRDPEGRYVPTSMILYADISDTSKFTYGTKVNAGGHAGFVVEALRFEHGPVGAHHVKVMVI
jgi:hypothetical protein